MKSIRYQTRRLTLNALNFFLSCRMYVLKISPASARFFQAITKLVYEPIQKCLCLLDLTDFYRSVIFISKNSTTLPNFTDR